MTWTEDVRNALADGPLTMDEILARVGALGLKGTAAAYRQAVYLGVRRGYLAKDGGLYRIARKADVRPSAEAEVEAYLREHGPSTPYEVADAVVGQGSENRSLTISVIEAPGTKCPRCWNYSTEADEEGLCPRCRSVVTAMK